MECTRNSTVFGQRGEFQGGKGRKNKGGGKEKEKRREGGPF
jgi:hypothetical protein